jgi:hypothetical protein
MESWEYPMLRIRRPFTARSALVLGNTIPMLAKDQRPANSENYLKRTMH